MNFANTMNNMSLQNQRQDQQNQLFEYQRKKLEEQEKKDNMLLPSAVLEDHITNLHGPETWNVMKKAMTDSGALKEVNGNAFVRAGDMKSVQEHMKMNNELVEQSMTASVNDAYNKMTQNMLKAQKEQDPVKRQQYMQEAEKAQENYVAGVAMSKEVLKATAVQREKNKGRAPGRPYQVQQGDKIVTYDSDGKELGRGDKFAPRQDPAVQWRKVKDPSSSTGWSEVDGRDQNNVRKNVPPPTSANEGQKGELTSNQTDEMLAQMVSYDQTELTKLRQRHLKNIENGMTRSQSVASLGQEFVTKQAIDARSADMVKKYKTPEALREAYKKGELASEEDLAAAAKAAQMMTPGRFK